MHVLYSGTEEKNGNKVHGNGTRCQRGSWRVAGSRMLSAVQALSAAAKRRIWGSAAPFLPALSLLGFSLDGEAQRPTMLRFHITNCYSILLLRDLLSCLALIVFFFQRNMPFALKRGCAGLEPTPHGCGNHSKSAGQNWLIPLCSRDLPQVRQVEATALVSFL